MKQRITIARQRFSLTLLAAGLILAPVGCADIAYYNQALSGQLQLLELRRPLDQMLADPDTEQRLRQRLSTARSMRDFASTELVLPDNGSYRSYADLNRSYVVRNVFAAPELSLEPYQWCFPLIGCINYRGYFDDAAAEKLAAKLQAEGYDVYLGNVPAYSTLGWFDDPLLNTFLDWPTGRLAELIFHELAHQQLYIADDSLFNESFATFVGRVGARRWLKKYGTALEHDQYESLNCHRKTFLTLVSSAKNELAELYASARDDAAKRSGKRHILQNLRDRYRIWKEQSENDFSGYDRWFSMDLNNAKLAALGIYNRYVPAFAVLFAENNSDFSAFYRAVEKLGRLPHPTREKRLQPLLESAPSGDYRDAKRCSAQHGYSYRKNDPA